MKPDTSRPIRTTFRLLSILAVLAVLAGAAAAHTLYLPAAVQSDAQGNWVTTAVFTAGPGSASLAAANVYGTENAGANEVMIDFCIPVFGEGETYELQIWGRLVDPGQPAAVGVQFAAAQSISGSR